MSRCAVLLVGLLLGSLAACATSFDYAPLPEPVPEPGVSLAKHSNGQLRRRTAILRAPNGREIPHGLEEFWFPDGTLERSATYERGELVGVLKSWWPDGTLRAEQDYADRATLAPFRWFHSNGQLEGEGLALAGRKQGPWTWFHRNGELSHEGSYEEGRREGPWRFFRPDGSPLAEGSYAAGRRVVPWIVWDETGHQSVRDFDPEAERRERTRDERPTERTEGAGETPTPSGAN